MFELPSPFAQTLFRTWVGCCRLEALLAQDESRGGGKWDADVGRALKEFYWLRWCV